MNTLKPLGTGVFPERSSKTVRAAQADDARSEKLRELALKGLFVFILGVALGLAGPYGTYGSVPLLSRLGFWVPILLVLWALWESLMALARGLFPQSLGARAMMALLMPVFAIFGSLFATAFSAMVFGLNGLSYLEAWAGSFANWLLFSFLIILPLAVITDALSRLEQRKGGENLLGFFSSKLPEKLQGSALIALQSEGHYLRVYTSAGSGLVLMTMEDAMSALSAFPGIRTHRSWWIAADQICPDFSLDASAKSLPSATGLEVPISRRRRKFVRDRLERYRNLGS